MIRVANWPCLCLAGFFTTFITHISEDARELPSVSKGMFDHVTAILGFRFSLLAQPFN
jgi:hypothetical protein